MNKDNLFNRNYSKEIIEGFDTEIELRNDKIKRIEEIRLSTRSKYGHASAKKEFYEMMVAKGKENYRKEKDESFKEYKELLDDNISMEEKQKKSILELMDEIEELEKLKKRYVDSLEK